MSVDVLREVFKNSQSRLVARNVLTVLADAAHPDGVTWLPIDPPKDKRRDQTRCLTHRARASRRAVIDAVQELQEIGEIEVRKAQRGRSRINVYRIVLGSIAELPIEYGDLPFDLTSPFGGSTVSPIRGAGSASSHEVRNLPPVTVDGVQTSPRLGADLVADGVHDGSGDAGEEAESAGEIGPRGGPEASKDPKGPTLGDPPSAESSLERSAPDLVGEFVEAWDRYAPEAALPRRFVGQLGAEVRTLLDEGQTAESLRAGLARMVDRRVMRPTLLGEFVAEAAVAGRAPAKKYGRRAVSAAEMDRVVARLEAEQEARELAAG